MTKVSRVFSKRYTYNARVGLANLTVFQFVAAAFGRVRRQTVARPLRSVLFLLTTAAVALLAPPFQAQDLGSTVRVVPKPDGAYFGVDGQYFNHTATFNWAKGTKHLFSVDAATQSDALGTTVYAFKYWAYNGVELPVGNIFSYTADPGVNEIQAFFELGYGLTLSFFGCPDAKNCPSPGTVYADKDAFKSDATIIKNAGAQVTLVAVPNAGYVFDGWVPGPNQSIHGLINTVTLNSATIAYPRFLPARRVTLATIPANTGLNLLADRSTVTNPATQDWGLDTLHTVGAVTPQQDWYGKWWAFSSWSDGGAATHAYRVGNSTIAETVTATFVPVAVTSITTQPPGLSIKVDGRDNWLSYNFPWGIGETHKLDAPAQLTDDQGRIWNFKSWSQGGAAAQSFTVPANAEDSGGVRLVATYEAVGRLLVKSSIAGLVVQIDGSECRTPCDIQRPVGSTVTVSAPTNLAIADGVRGDFTGWPGSGNLAPVWSGKLGSDVVNLKANYQIMNRLATAATPPEGVRWRLDPGSADGFYEVATPVTVSVTAQPGYKFRGWNGDLSGTAPAGVVAMTGPRAIQAILDRVPYIMPAGVGNAAGSIPRDGVAPGSVVSIFGVNLASDTVAGPENPLAQTLGRVTVRVGDRFLPLFFVSPSQINGQLPPDIGDGNQVLTVSSAGLPDVRATFNVVRNAPGIFPQAFHEDGSAVNADSPARRGELITFYGTGFGPTDRPRPEGFAVPVEPLFVIADAVSVRIGEVTAAAEKAYAASGRVGVDAVQFRIPDDTASGAGIALVVNVNGQDSNTVTLPVQ